MATKTWNQNITITDPPVAQALLGNTRWAWLWLVARLYVGYTWLTSGWGKIINPGWVQTGEALKGFWERAVAIPDAPARPPIAFDWYRTFLKSLRDSGSNTWFAKLVVAGEILIGFALILGMFTGIAAIFGGFMNWNFMMAGSASTNPLLFFLAVLLVLAWKTAGWWGLDHWLLPLLGSPWQSGRLFTREKEQTILHSIGEISMYHIHLPRISKRLFIGLTLLTLSLLVAACSAPTTPVPTPTSVVMPMQSDSMEMDMGVVPAVPAGIAYAEGQEIRFIHTEVSDPEIAKLLSDMMSSPVLVVPSLASAPEEMLSKVYVFTNGIQGMGPLGFQPDIFDNPPGTPGYSPLRTIILATWKDESQARELRSVGEIAEAESAGEITLEQPGVVVNMPFITWPGGQR